MHLKQTGRVFILVVFSVGVLMQSAVHGETGARIQNPAVSPTDRERADVPAVRDELRAVENVFVELQGAGESPGAYEQMARSLILLRQGDFFSQEKLQESVDALKRCNRFQIVEADVREAESGNVVLHFLLKPGTFIKNIEITGIYPLFEREVLNQMTIYPGDLFNQEELPEQASLVQELYMREGYVNPQVEITAEKNPSDDFIVVHVHINKGAYYTLKHLDIQGNRAFSDARLRIRMVAWRQSLLPGSSGRFIEKNLQKDLETLTTFYRRKRYPDARVRVRIERDPTLGEAYALVNIDEGSRYRVRFTGDEHMWKWRLRKDLVLFKQGNWYNRGLRKSVKNMEARYRKKGFLDADVTVRDKAETVKGVPVRNLTLAVREGPCSRVNQIRFSGNTAFTEEKLRKQMLIRPEGLLARGAFVPGVLEEDRMAIKALYSRHGYLDTKVEEEVRFSKDKEEVSILLRIEEGPRTMLHSVKVDGATVLSPKEIGKTVKLRDHEPFRKYMVRSDENALSARISEKGYPLVKVTGDVSVSEDRSEANIVYNVEQGPYMEMGDIHCAGNFRTKHKVFERELEMESGDPFSLEKMLEGQRNIRDLGILDSVGFTTAGLRQEAERVTLFVNVEEKKPYYFQIGGGYESQRGLFAHSKVGDRNLLGRNKEVWVAGEASQIGYRGEGGITEPRFLGTKVSASLNLFGEQREEFNQDFGTVLYGSSLSLTRKWTRRLRTSLNFSYERREQFPRDGNAAEERSSVDAFDARSIWVTTPMVRYDSRDSFIRPTAGILSSVSLDVSKGLENALDDFVKVRLDLRYYWSPLERLTFAWHGWVGHIEPYGPERAVPEDQLFFLGGTLDVRGYRENMLLFDGSGDSVGGQTAWVGSLEARIDVGLNFEFDMFVDAGRLSSTYHASEKERLGSSAGLGLRYITPIGPVGVMYGFKLDPRRNEDIGRFHFAIGYTF